MKNSNCPICLETTPAVSWRGNEAKRLLCCGHLVCSPCADQYQPHNFVANQGKETCPLCRANVPSTEEEGFELVQKHAKNGQAWAQHNIGDRYSKGRGVSVSNELALFWYTKAAEQNYAASMHGIGALYQTGKMTDKDKDNYKIAEEWYKKAIEQDYTSSQYNLGVIYKEQGKHEQALYYLRLAAEQKFHLAECELGIIYEHGDCGLPVDLALAEHWYELAAWGNNPIAQFNYGGLFFQKGRVSVALCWLRKIVKTPSDVQANAVQLLASIEKALSTACSGCEGKANSPNALKRCGGCMTPWYCSSACQKKHWSMSHKKECKDAQELNKKLDAL
eukprot:Pgem_evm1s17563